MTPREIASLCCRVVALFYIVESLFGIPTLFDWMLMPFDGKNSGADEVIQQIVWLGYSVVIALAAIFLWRRSWVIGAWMVGHNLQDRPDEPDIERRRASAADLHSVAFSTLGLWVLIDAIPRSASYLTQLLYVHNFDDSTRQAGLAYQAATWIELVLRIFIGVWLVFGSRALVRFINRVRNVGLEAEERPGNSQDGKARP